MTAAIVRRDWFEQAERHQITPGATLAEIVHACNVPHWLEQAGEVCINGEIIPRENWHKVRPKQGTREKPVIVSIYPPALHGGGNQGGTKQVITIVASIALIAGAALISGGTLAPFLGAWAGTALGGAALGSPFGVRGALKLPALPC